MSRVVWFWKPSLYWFGWKTLIPVYIGWDEYRRKCVVLGWMFTGRVVIAVGRYTSLRLIDSPKSVREALCVAQQSMLLRDDPRLMIYIDKVSRLIDECDRNRPLGPDGSHGDRHTATCGCEW